jgi:hypothetical protein
MTMALELLAFVVVLGVTSLWVLAPVRRARAPRGVAPGDLAALEAERDMRIAAVRDADLDLQTGKLSADDHRALDGQLRAEALDALRVLEAARADEGGDR